MTSGTDTPVLTAADERFLSELVRQLRTDSIRCSTAAGRVTLPRYQLGDRVATRKAYGDALVALGARPEVVALDGEVGNATYAGEFAAAFPDRFFEMFIAEQQLIAAAVGLAVRGYVPFASTFAAFLSRGYDFLRMAGICAPSTAPPCCTRPTPPQPLP